MKSSRKPMNNCRYSNLNIEYFLFGKGKKYFLVTD